MVVHSSGLIGSWAKSWLSKNWALSPSALLGIGFSPSGRLQDSYFQVSYSDTAVSRGTASFEGFLLEVRKLFPEALSRVSSKPLLTHWPELGPCPF